MDGPLYAFTRKPFLADSYAPFAGAQAVRIITGNGTGRSLFVHFYLI